MRRNGRPCAFNAIRRLQRRLGLRAVLRQGDKLGAGFENARKYARQPRRGLPLAPGILDRGESVISIDVTRTQDIFPQNRPPFEVDHTGSPVRYAPQKSPHSSALEEVRRTRAISSFAIGAVKQIERAKCCNEERFSRRSSSAGSARGNPGKSLPALNDRAIALLVRVK